MEDGEDQSTVPRRRGELAQSGAPAGTRSPCGSTDGRAPAAAPAVSVRALTTLWVGEGGLGVPATHLLKPKRLYLRAQLSEANDKMLAVQECYISVCTEKDMLEQREHSRAEEEDARIKECQVYMEMS